LDSVTAILAALDGHSLALLLCYFGVHVAFAAFFVPCSPLTFLAGSIWGIWPGLAISSGAALLASGVTFAIGRSAPAGIGARFIARSSFVRRSSELAGRVLGLGWRSVVLVQGNPLVPASSAGYIFGMTRMRARVFLTVNFLATLPLQAVLVASGAAAYDAIVLQQVREFVVFSMIFATVLLGFWMIARRSLRRPVETIGQSSEVGDNNAN